MPSLSGVGFPRKLPSIQNTSAMISVSLPGITAVDWVTTTINTAYQVVFTDLLVEKLIFAQSGNVHHCIGIAASTLYFKVPSAPNSTFNFYLGGDNNTGTEVVSIGSTGIDVNPGYIITINGVAVMPIDCGTVSSLNNLNTKTFIVPKVQGQQNNTHIILYLGFVGTNSAVIPAIQIGYSDNTFSSGPYQGCQGGQTTAEVMGALLEIWHNGWSTSHSVTGEWHFQFIGTTSKAAEPKDLWLIWGTAARYDAGPFLTVTSCTVYLNSTKTVDRIRIYTDIFDNFTYVPAGNIYSDASIAFE